MQDYVLVRHWTSGGVVDLQRFLDGEKADPGSTEYWSTPHLQGILLIKAEQYAGFDATTADQLEHSYNRRVHFVSYAIPNVDIDNHQTCSPQIKQRFDKFKAAIADLRAGTSIPWHFLEPPSWPEEVVAVYLALIAAGRGTEIELPDQVWNDAGQQAKELWDTDGPAMGRWPGFAGGGVRENQNRLPALQALFAEIAKKRDA